MITRVRNINPVQLGVVSAVLYALLALIMALLMVPMMSLVSQFGGNTGQFSSLGAFGGLSLIVVLPIFYGVAGFIGGLITALIYNLVAGWTGGIEVTLATHEPVASVPVAT